MVINLTNTTYENSFQLNHQTYRFADIAEFLAQHQVDVDKFPYTIRILLEAAVRRHNHNQSQGDELTALVHWDDQHDADVAYKPERVILQDFTGVPALVDLAAMRDAIAKKGGDVQAINPEVPVDLVIDHSVQVDRSGDDTAFAFNVQKEFERNHERYTFLKWAQNSFDNLTVIPPDTGIIHQVNLERLATVVMTKQQSDGSFEAFPDTLVGTDSHTTMINGLGVLGWGVGGIEAEASMLGENSFMPIPKVVGVKLTGRLAAGVTATDLALTLTNLLRQHQVVGKFVEFYGEGLDHLPLAYRATVANMAPEYGATCGFFPIDRQTLDYLKLTDRPAALIELVEQYAHQNHLFYESGQDDQRQYSEYETLDLGTVESSVAGPNRPQDLVKLAQMPQQFDDRRDMPAYPVMVNEQSFELRPGSLGIAAITSCTNTSNPQVLLAAALVAKRAVELGLKVPAYVKTSFAPGSRVVMEYLKAAGLQQYLDEIGFNLVGYGCTTCIGNSGQLLEELQSRLSADAYPIAAVESGNRNFEGRVNPLVKDTYLASPPLVVVYALAGTCDIDLTTEPVGTGRDGQPVYMKDLWPSDDLIADLTRQYLSPKQFSENYQQIFQQNETWNQLEAPTSATYDWDTASTYIASPPFFETADQQPEEIQGIRVLAKVGDSITTDHISPAGFIGSKTPAGKYLQDHGIAVRDFNSYGSRRGNHEVMMRGTLANIRLKNELAPGTTGGFTTYLPTNEPTTIFEASREYLHDQTPLLILAGKDYGMGSSRDWAAKGVKLLGVKVIIAESFERIHRSNLAMMGIIPLEYLPGETAATIGLDGTETYTIQLDKQIAHVTATTATRQVKFDTRVRFDTPIDWTYYEHGGILPLIVDDKLNA
ncbi:aconitate hydratase [Paucilactobacillus vaccinostercus DSM 20634]|uniref:Aconitate hydratase n=1 Tax=Paucilactobacillus vaccinostercus DSM 20634 TaxID=1423813 RepID=A0A0R2A096_9LACO|nr:aconitate hydratase AcnA [Paucilactobacillus vaccinostercus]KRM60529.1 aconitate hydratase [Paucilactobacillus vaccinostercus DSM 20634]